MNKAIKVTIGIIAIALGGMSVAQADQNRHKRQYDNPRHQQFSRQHDYDHWTYRNKRQETRRDRRDRRHDRHYRKHHRHHDHGYRHGHKHRYGHRHGHKYRYGHRHARKHFRHGYRSHRHGVPPRVIIERRHHSRHIHGPELPVIVGGLAGAAIANDISNGDPAATIGGAVIGTVVGKVLSY